MAHQGGIAQRQTVAAGLIAIGVIGEGGVDDAAGDRCDRMRERLAGLGIAVIADIRLDQDVADRVVGEALGDIDADCAAYDSRLIFVKTSGQFMRLHQFIVYFYQWFN